MDCGGSGDAFVTLGTNGQLKTKKVTETKTVTIRAGNAYSFEIAEFTVTINP